MLVKTRAFLDMGAITREKIELLRCQDENYVAAQKERYSMGLGHGMGMYGKGMHGGQTAQYLPAD